MNLEKEIARKMKLENEISPFTTLRYLLIWEFVDSNLSDNDVISLLNITENKWNLMLYGSTNIPNSEYIRVL